MGICDFQVQSSLFCFFYSTFTHLEENENKLLTLIHLKVLRAVSSYWKCSRSLRLPLPSSLQNKLASYQGCFLWNININWYSSVRFTPGLRVPEYMHVFSELRTNQTSRHLSHIPHHKRQYGNNHTSPGGPVDIHLRGRRNQKDTGPERMGDCFDVIICHK